MTKNILQHTKQLRAAFPGISEKALQKMVMETFRAQAGGHHFTSTVSDVLAPLRQERMLDEVARDRAKVKADGTMRLKDTSTYRTYETTWVRFEKMFGNKVVADLKAADLKKVALAAQRSARTKLQKKNSQRISDGFAVVDETGNAGYNRALAALSAFFTFALDNSHCDKNIVVGMKRLPENGRKRGKLTPDEIDVVLQAAISGGDDPILDHLVLWTLVETAARVGGLLNMQLQDINLKDQTISLHEKGSKVRLQPVTKELATTLVAFAKLRGATHPTDAVFRFGANSKSAHSPMTSRRIDTMWARLRKELPWLAERHISSHAIRRSVLTLVERTTGSTSVARAYAGHAQRNVTDGYTEADGNEVARALQMLFGRPHPLA